MDLRKTRLIVVTLCALMFATYLSITRAATPRQDIEITKGDQTATMDCSGKDVRVSSDDNKLTLRGVCDKLTVQGDDNIITALHFNEVEVDGDDNILTVDTVAKIAADGDDNTITWKTGPAGKAPDISNKGSDNKIVKAGP